MSGDNAAFPVSEAEGSNPGGYPGMTLRDYFAAKAMQGWLASFSGENGWPGAYLRSMASSFYNMADAMIAVRDARTDPEVPEQSERLRAAAPELLDALKALEPYLPDIVQVKDDASLNDGRASSWGVAAIKAREAIAKAEGR